MKQDYIQDITNGTIFPENHISRELQLTLIALQTMGSILSFTGSSLIILMIVRGSKENKLSKIHNRILMGMSVMDLLNDFALGVATLAAPREYSHLMLGASGNRLSCSIQGFIIVLGFSIPSYNATLNFYYLAVIKYDIPDDVLEKYELFAHGYAVFPSIFIAVFSACYGLFGPVPNTTYCSLSQYSCDIYTTDCVLSTIELVLGVLCALNLLIIIISMTMIYLHVRKQSIAMKNEYRSFKHRTIINENIISSETQRNETFIQACLYVSAYTITYVWWILMPFPPFLFFAYISMNIFYPLQGLWNFITFARPRFILIKKKHEEYSFWETMNVVVFGQDSDSPHSSEEDDVSHTITSDPKTSLVFSDVLCFPSTMSNRQSIGNSGVMGSVISRDDLSGFEGIDDIGDSFSSYGQSSNNISSHIYSNSAEPLLSNNVTNYSSTMRISVSQEDENELLTTKRGSSLNFQFDHLGSDASLSMDRGAGSTIDETSCIDNNPNHPNLGVPNQELDTINENVLSSIEGNEDSRGRFSPTRRNITMLEAQDRIKVRRNLTTIVAQDIVIRDSLAERNHLVPEVIEEGPPGEIYVESSDSDTRDDLR